MFRKLQQEAGKSFKLVAVLPEPVDEADRYFNEQGVHVDQIKQATLGSIGIRGTPMMLLVNGSGIVTQTWIGRLEPEEQDGALNILHDLAHAQQPREIGKG